MSHRIPIGPFLVLLAGPWLATAFVHAQTTWYVDDDAPADPCPGNPNCGDPLEDGSADHPFDAIQEGIDAAVDGDTVMVLDGTYTGTGNRDLDFGGKAITVRSENGPERCIIDCEGDPNDPHRGFLFQNGEGPDTIVEGLTITNGYVGANGGAVYCDGSSPALTNCTITMNSTSAWGGGVCCCHYSSPTLTKCIISANSTHEWGGGVYCFGNSSPTLTNCTIDGNSTYYHGGGIHCFLSSSPMLVNCTIRGNSAACCYGDGGGVYCLIGSSPTLANCTISANSAGRDGAGVYCWYSSPTLTNCILWGDTPQDIYVDSADPVVTYCNVQGGWTGMGNVDADPQFVRAPTDGGDGWGDDPNTPEDESANDDYGDLHLQPGSPCIDAADNDSVPPDCADLDGDGDTDEPTSFDLDGNPRFVDDPDTDDTGNGTAPIVDMGAYEFQAGIVAHLDIRPGSCPNPLNVQSHGVLTAAIVGTAEFDVTQIDVDTLVLTRADGMGGSVTPLTGPPGPGIRVDDVATPFDGEPCECHEYEGDGIDDLSMKFDTETLVAELQLAEFPGGMVVELVVSGQLLDGAQFSGTDCITIRPTRSQAGATLGAPENDTSMPEAEPQVAPTGQQGTE